MAKIKIKDKINVITYNAKGKIIKAGIESKVKNKVANATDKLSMKEIQELLVK